jgi:two-component system, chemotaxis family, chemotaxis protein CheY
MPEMSGLELVRRIRADEKLARTPFLMTSVDGAVARARIAREAGVNAFLIKPFGDAALRTKLHEVLGPSGMRAAA